MKKTIKQFITSVMGAALVMGITGCGNDSSKPDNRESSSTTSAISTEAKHGLDLSAEAARSVEDVALSGRVSILESNVALANGRGDYNSNQNVLNSKQIVLLRGDINRLGDSNRVFADRISALEADKFHSNAIPPAAKSNARASVATASVDQAAYKAALRSIIETNVFGTNVEAAASLYLGNCTNHSSFSNVVVGLARDVGVDVAPGILLSTNYHSAIVNMVAYKAGLSHDAIHGFGRNVEYVFGKKNSFHGMRPGSVEREALVKHGKSLMRLADKARNPSSSRRGISVNNTNLPSSF